MFRAILDWFVDGLIAFAFVAFALWLILRGLDQKQKKRLSDSCASLCRPPLFSPSRHFFLPSARFFASSAIGKMARSRLTVRSCDFDGADFFIKLHSSAITRAAVDDAPQLTFTESSGGEFLRIQDARFFSRCFLFYFYLP